MFCNFPLAKEDSFPCLTSCFGTILSWFSVASSNEPLVIFGAQKLSARFAFVCGVPKISLLYFKALEFLLIVSTGVKFGFFKNNLKFRFARKLYQEIGPGKCTTRMWKDEFLVIVIRLCFYFQFQGSWEWSCQGNRTSYFSTSIEGLMRNVILLLIYCSFSWIG